MVPVHFLHIRKTGGTAVAEALRPLAPSHGLILHDHNTRLSDVPRNDRVVFFLRHPISRFVSGFYSRLRRGLPRHCYEWNQAEATAFRHFQKANDLAEALSGPDSETAARAQAAMRGISHIKNTYESWFAGIQEINDRLDSVVLIGLQEKLVTDFQYLKKRLQLPESLSLPADDTLAHRTPPEFNRQLSPLAERNLSSWYADDIRFYERCMQLRADRGL